MTNDKSKEEYNNGVAEITQGNSIELSDGYEIEIFKTDEIDDDGYEFAGFLNKDGEMLDDFEGSGNFAIKEDVVTYLKDYLVNFEKIAINEQNIALYYEFMSDESKEDNSNILDKVFLNRARILVHELKTKSDTLDNNQFIIDRHNMNEVSNYCTHMTGISFFGVKDTLKPIDEYISEIKDSVAYKEYVDVIVCDRLLEATEMLNISSDIILDLSNVVTFKEEDDNTLFLSIDYFGIKDTLKPIDEYITEIKSSDAYKTYSLENIMEKYDLGSEASLRRRAVDLFADDLDYVASIDDLIYTALDEVADDFKMNVINYIEDNNLQEKTEISCISDMEVIIENGEFQGLFKEFDLVDFEEENIIAFIDKHKEVNRSNQSDTEEAKLSDTPMEDEYQRVEDLQNQNSQTLISFN
jgi:hypothetical protein